MPPPTVILATIASLLLAAALPSSLAQNATESAVHRPVGLVVLTRHGARTPLYKNPATFSEGESQLTLEGQNQHYQNGLYLRSLYAADAGSINPIKGLSATYDDFSKIYVRSSDFDRTINSASSLLMGLFPANASLNLVMADGTTTYATLGGLGVQEVPVHVVPEMQDLITRGWINCTKLEKLTADYYASPEYATADVEAQPLLQSLSARFNNTKLRLQDMWNVFDVLNVQKSYNKSFVDLTAAQWNEVNQLVNSLEYNKFANGLGATSFAGDVAKQLKAMSASGNKKLIHYYSGHYTTFESFFGLSRLSDVYPELRNIPDYASMLAFELSKLDGRNTTYVRVLYRNGVKGVFKSYTLLGLSEYTEVDQMVSALATMGTSDLPSWCTVCGNTVSRGCETLAAALSASPGGLTDVQAGVIGAAVALASVAVIAGLVALIVSQRKKRAAKAKALSAEEKLASTKGVAV